MRPPRGFFDSHCSYQSWNRQLSGINQWYCRHQIRVAHWPKSNSPGWKINSPGQVKIIQGSHLQLKISNTKYSLKSAFELQQIQPVYMIIVRSIMVKFRSLDFFKFLLMTSNALVRSTKAKYRLRCCSLHFSWRILDTGFTSKVLWSFDREHGWCNAVFQEAWEPWMISFTTCSMDGWFGTLVTEDQHCATRRIWWQQPHATTDDLSPHSQTYLQAINQSIN